MSPWDPRPMSMYASYQKKQEYIRFSGGDPNGFCGIWPFIKWRGRGIARGTQVLCQ